MKQLFYLFIAVTFLGLAACNSAPKKEGEAEGETTGVQTEEVAAINTLTEKEIAEGWILMFDGESTKGWREYDEEVFPDTGWHIEDGLLACENSGNGEAGFGGDIIFDKQFTNFHLKVDWMIEEGGNSGIFYLARELEGKKIWYTAPEYQILDNFGTHIDNTLGKDGNRRAGSLYDLIPPDPQNAKGPMEWNTAEIVSYEGTIAYKMNGETTLEFHLWTPEWKEMIANSKFPDFNPDFADVAKTGYIGLQDHGHAVWFRNIKIREL
jgi:alpha-3'-ketoglucosidase